MEFVLLLEFFALKWKQQFSSVAYGYYKHKQAIFTFTRNEIKATLYLRAERIKSKTLSKGIRFKTSHWRFLLQQFRVRGNRNNYSERSSAFGYVKRPANARSDISNEFFVDNQNSSQINEHICKRENQQGIRKEKRWEICLVAFKLCIIEINLIHNFLLEGCLWMIRHRVLVNFFATFLAILPIKPQPSLTKNSATWV